MSLKWSQEAEQTPGPVCCQVSVPFMTSQRSVLELESQEKSYNISFSIIFNLSSVLQSVTKILFEQISHHGHDFKKLNVLNKV